VSEHQPLSEQRDSKRLRGEPEGFGPRLRWWLRQEYRYWDRVEVIERELRPWIDNEGTVTALAMRIAGKLQGR
jgi:hypothetical protein